MKTHGQRLVGRYAIFDEIASGGMGAVHLGRFIGPAGFRRTVAIKRVHPSYANDRDFTVALLDEARVASRITHPNVVSTLDVADDNGQLLLVMEYIHGDSLSQIMRRMRKAGATIPPRIVVAIISNALHGLHAAHEATDEDGLPLDVVHRDVSPHNILVGMDGVARIADFGIAKAAGCLAVTQTGAIKGKFAYMAPEQVFGKKLTRAADIFSASVVLWEALTSKRFSTPTNRNAHSPIVVAATAAAPSSLARGLNPAFDHVVARGTAMTPEARFPTAREMARALEACAPAVRASEVAEWMEKIAGAEVHARSCRIAEIETYVIDVEPPASESEEPLSRASRATPQSLAPVLPVTSSIPFFDGTTVNERELTQVESLKRRVVRLATMALASIAIGVSYMACSHAEQRLAMSSPGVAPSTLLAEVKSIAAAPSPTASIEDVDSPKGRPESSPSSTAPAASPSHSVRVPRPPPSPRSECDPPWWIEGTGRKRFKAECL